MVNAVHPGYIAQLSLNMLALQTSSKNRLAPDSTEQVYRGMATVQLYRSISGPIIVGAANNFNIIAIGLVHCPVE